jgi:sulfur relay (sulfurtransferase) DsrF/TusC family protein
MTLARHISDVESVPADINSFFDMNVFVPQRGLLFPDRLLIEPVAQSNLSMEGSRPVCEWTVLTALNKGPSLAADGVHYGFEVLLRIAGWRNLAKILRGFGDANIFVSQFHVREYTLETRATISTVGPKFAKAKVRPRAAIIAIAVVGIRACVDALAVILAERKAWRAIRLFIICDGNAAIRNALGMNCTLR